MLVPTAIIFFEKDWRLIFENSVAEADERARRPEWDRGPPTKLMTLLQSITGIATIHFEKKHEMYRAPAILKFHGPRIVRRLERKMLHTV